MARRGAGPGQRWKLIRATAFGGTLGACGDDRGCGTIFRITPSGTLTTLHSFDIQDGEQPFAPLVQDTNGTSYGTTHEVGYPPCDGTVFRLSVGLPPFVETQPPYAKLGMTVKILGTNLTGATSVTFNGTPAVIEAISSSVIGVTVPIGATTGNVQVLTPYRTLSSNVRFRVVP